MHFGRHTPPTPRSEPIVSHHRQQDNADHTAVTISLPINKSRLNEQEGWRE
jgi:hypothetical protein